jgi:transcriptional accessory protein Tex/SPT6
MADKFVENPMEVLKVGEAVDVRILEVDRDRKRISLSRKKDDGTGHVNISNGSGAQRKGGKKNPQQQELKNNAFAALKNFKV